MIYAAYGSNMSRGQMAYRCPGAKAVSVGVLEGWRLTFAGHGFANVEPHQSAKTWVLLWEVEEHHIKALDRYEGFPRHYTKKYTWVRPLGQKKIRALMYVMIPELGSKPAIPSNDYFDGIFEAYEDLNISVKPLTDAVIASGLKLEGWKL